MRKLLRKFQFSLKYSRYLINKNKLYDNSFDYCNFEILMILFQYNNLKFVFFF